MFRAHETYTKAADAIAYNTHQMSRYLYSVAKFQLTQTTLVTPDIDAHVYSFS